MALGSKAGINFVSRDYVMTGCLRPDSDLGIYLES